MPSKLADPDTQLDVDEAILDYLLYVATATLLHNARVQGRNTSKSEEWQADLLPQMVDCECSQVLSRELVAVESESEAWLAT